MSSIAGSGTSRRDLFLRFPLGIALMAASLPLESLGSPAAMQPQGSKKYAKYIVTAHRALPEAKVARGGDLDKLETPKLHHIMSLSSAVAEGSIMVNCSWVLAGEDPGRMEAHVHPYPEVIGFVGGDPRNADELGAEAEFWLGDEQYFINQSFLAYVPSGLKHCPLLVRNIKRDFFHFDIQLTTGQFRAAPLRK